jgi:hypothetical protein
MLNIVPLPPPPLPLFRITTLKFEAFSQGEAKYLEVYKQQKLYSIYKYV